MPVIHVSNKAAREAVKGELIKEDAMKSVQTYLEEYVHLYFFSEKLGLITQIHYICALEPDFTRCTCPSYNSDAGRV